MGRPWTMCPIDIPNRESLEPQIKKINNRCRLRLLEFLKQTMKPEFEEIMGAMNALGDICGTKVSDNYTGPLCGNWRGCAKCSYENIIGIETLFPEKMELSFWLLILQGKMKKKDERVDCVLDMIQRKHDCSNHVWGVKEATSSEFEETDKEEGQDQAADTEIGENSHVAESVDGTTDVSGRHKKFETETTQLRTASDRTEQFETVVTDMLGKIVTESIIDTGPNTSKKDTAPSKKKLNTDDSCVNLPLVNLTQSLAIDLRIQKTKPEDSLDVLEPPKSLKMSAMRLDDREIDLTGKDDPDHCLVFVRKKDYKKMQDWQDT
ncbi:hypothetical protein IGI04_030706 [Brassica rapa subsp. trilocularis]|uniref:DUF287 domain-containing protein n=1 Tax=Brassica rapa subsp. trilocularis TaxID=1813537 RepID=A0ABQ7LT47_BRACM|nr:hypothetical protein IGI04_030706 [Brassica rapa subsp. trilocularis]